MQETKRVKNPGKQRKMLFNAPAHLRHKLMAAPMSPELLAQKGIKALPVRKGDTVRIMRGDHKGFEGKVSRVDLKAYRIYLAGLTREKVDGTAVFVALHPSKVMIKTLNLDDKLRKAVLERKTPIIKKTAKPAKKVPTPKKIVETAKEPEVAEIVPEEKIIEESTPEIKVPETKATVEKTIAETIPEVKPKAKAAVQKKLPAEKKVKEEAKPAKEETAETKATPKATKKPAVKKAASKAAEKKPVSKRKTTSKAEGGT
jgi:large subunit ribosomal protein L24